MILRTVLAWCGPGPPEWHDGSSSVARNGVRTTWEGVDSIDERNGRLQVRRDPLGWCESTYFPRMVNVALD